MTNTTNIADLKTVAKQREERLPAIVPGFSDLQSFELMQRIAKMFSASPLVPKIYQGPEGLPSTVIALNMAMRMQADPLMVMQNLYVVHGRPAWSAQFLIACFNQCGRFSAIRYRWQGKEGDKDWGCRAYATELRTSEDVVGPLVTMATAKAEGWIDRNGSKWLTIPELMLTYRAAAWMIRTHAPEIAMGLPTQEEVGETYDVTPVREVLTPADIAAGSHVIQPVVGEVTQAAVTIPLASTGDEPAPRQPPEFSYAQIAEQINAAKTADEVNDALSLVDKAFEKSQKVELMDLAKARIIEVSK